MRYCHNCHRITNGEPLYCQNCGFTYDAKLCPSRHLNPRWAVVCSQCGSRDLSTPAPRIPLWLAPVTFALTLIPGVVLALALILLVVSVFHALLTNHQVQFQPLALILIATLPPFPTLHL